MTEKVKQRSRIFRDPNPKIIEITDRVISELEILYRHRLATTDVFQAVLSGSDQKIKKGLRDLYDNGYVDRPSEQWIMHKKYKGGRGRSEIIYALANKGIHELAKRGYKTTGTDLNRKNHELGETTIFHDACLTKIWACLKTALEQKRAETAENYELVLWQQDRPDRDQLKTEIELDNYKTKNLIPDAAFKIQTPISQFLFLVEYYRTRKGGHQRYLDQLKLYNRYYDQRKFEKYGVKKGFRVITVVPNRTIVSNLIKMIKDREENKELLHFRFWFVSEEDFRIYSKERIPGENYFKKELDVKSILEPVFRISVSEGFYSLDDYKV